MATARFDSGQIRARICDGLGFLGIALNETRNAKSAPLISADAGRVAVRVIRADEESMIARSVCRVLGLGMASEEGIPTMRGNASLGGTRLRKAESPIIHGGVINHGESAPSAQ